MYITSMKNLLKLFGICLLGRLAIATSAILEVVHIKHDTGNYKMSFWQAYEACQAKGWALTTPEELKSLHKDGYSECSCGWLADHTARYPVVASDSAACGIEAGVHTCDWQDTYNAYCTKYAPLKKCTEPLGVEKGDLSQSSFAGSSVNKAWWGEVWQPWKAKLNNNGLVNAWMPYHDDRNQYLQISFDEVMDVTGIITQGASRYTKWQYVTKFRVHYNRYDNGWIPYNDNQIFEGNSDNNGLVRNWFNPSIKTTAIRIYPYEWVKHITLRVELFGCDPSVGEEEERKQRIDKLTNGSLY